MRVPASILAAVAAPALLAQPASAQTITLQNGDFEQGDVLGENGFSVTAFRGTPGWTWSGGGGTGRWNPPEWRMPDPDPNPEPDSDQNGHGTVAWVSGPIAVTPDGNFLGQVVDGLVLQANTLYTLTLDVGTALDVPLWGYSFGLLATTSEPNVGLKLAEMSGTTDADGNTIPLGSFTTLTLTYQTGETGAEIGQSLIIALGGLGAGSAYDNVTLRATSLAGPVPEPSTWAMMLFGFGAVGTALRRQRKASAQPA